jgi:hypothetical protein
LLRRRYEYNFAVGLVPLSICVQNTVCYKFGNIQSIVQVNIVQSKNMVKFAVPERVDVTNAIDFPTFGKHKNMKMSGQ